MQTLTKHPTDVRDLVVHFEAFLARTADSIASTAFTVPAGLTKGTETTTLGTAKCRISGGTAGTDYKVVCRITTAAGQVVNRSVLVEVRDL